jgi:hypothetical protein
MDRSGWRYFVAYQPDLDAALADLRAAAFAEGDYVWPYECYHDLGDKPRPRTIEELTADELIQEAGTHSILDMEKVVAPGEEPDVGTVEPISAREARERIGTERLTRAHVAALAGLADRRWFGRCAVLHDDEGQPKEIYFWGDSGD